MSSKIINSCKSCTARCCRGLAVVLTIPEALRLLSAIGARPEEILEFNDNINARETPHYPLLAKKGGRVIDYFIIIKRDGSDCIFLNKDRTCKIYSHRAYVCKLYPYMLDGKTIKKKILCPVKFEPEGYVEDTAKHVAEDLFTHGVLAREWSATHSEVPVMSRFLEYFSALPGEDEGGKPGKNGKGKKA